MKLEANENSDLLDYCCPLNESLFKEVFNRMLWKWYKEFGLANDDAPREYLKVIDGKLLFDADVASFEKKGFMGNILSSIRFSSKAIDLVKRYDSSAIDILYEKAMLTDYSKFKKEALIKGFENTWEMLVDNFKYAILAGLIIQYKLKIELPKQLESDIVSERYNALLKLKRKQISKQDFDNRFGFLAEQDYDFSCPRYSEQNEIRVPYSNEIQPSQGIHNFRENVKYDNIKLIAIIRKILLASKIKDPFYKYKGEIVGRENVDTEKRKKKTAVKEKEKSVNAKELSGIPYSGSGELEGKAVFLKGLKGWKDSYKDCIIISETLSPDFVALMPMTLGVIAERGGRLSHLAVVARESDYAIIGQAKDAVKMLDGKRIRVIVKEGRIVIL